MFQKIDHVNISVKDLVESAFWYKKVFGFEKVEEGINMSGSKFMIVANQDTMICMSEHRSWKEPNLEANHQHQIFHFGFRISDENCWKELIKLHELELTYGEVRYPNSKSWYVLDPNGYEIEVSCLKPGLQSMFILGSLGSNY